MSFPSKIRKIENIWKRQFQGAVQRATHRFIMRNPRLAHGTSANFPATSLSWIQATKETQKSFQKSFHHSSSFLYHPLSSPVHIPEICPEMPRYSNTGKKNKENMSRQPSNAQRLVWWWCNTDWRVPRSLSRSSAPHADRLLGEAPNAVHWKYRTRSDPALWF